MIDFIHQVNYLIVTTPRSGGSFIAKLLTENGFQCGHETHINVSQEYYAPTDPPRHRQDLYGEASWPSVPRINEFSTNTVLFHQIRDPLKTISSIAINGHFESNKWADYIRNHLSHVPWPENDLQKAAIFWTEWHKMIEESIGTRRYLRYKLEDINPKLIVQMGEMIGVHVDVNRVEQTMARLGNKTNHRKPVSYQIKWKDLPSETQELATKYGYTS